MIEQLPLEPLFECLFSEVCSLIVFAFVVVVFVRGGLQVEVMDSPREDASCIRTLSRKDEVHIYGEREDATDPTILWYLVNDSAPQWIKADTVKLDATWAK